MNRPDNLGEENSEAQLPLIKLDDLLKATANSREQLSSEQQEQPQQIIDVDKLNTMVAQLDLDFNNWLTKLNLKHSKHDLTRPLFRRSSIDELAKANADTTSEYLDCPYDRQHTRILRKNFERHVNTCKLKRSKYSSNEIVS